MLDISSIIAGQSPPERPGVRGAAGALGKQKPRFRWPLHGAIDPGAMGRKRIGELLLERGVISQHQLEEALMQQQLTRQRLGAILVQRGSLVEEQLVKVLGEALGIREVDLGGLKPEWAAIH